MAPIRPSIMSEGAMHVGARFRQRQRLLGQRMASGLVVEDT